ncbi:hypothetical protein F2Q68_00043634 [Brassica cretica]|uniref:At2g35280-like TPR domain-containing protein n=1 Tax=Brassica cretica TaxID=69181 RepID=A0A8S9LIF9_BRACR|nr:hypothetical protein F2Q68_00043634 [Brassica cretica]
MAWFGLKKVKPKLGDKEEEADGDHDWCNESDADESNDLNLLSHLPHPQLSMKPLYKLLRGRSVYVAAIHGSRAASYVRKHGRRRHVSELGERLVVDIRVALAFVDKRFASSVADALVVERVAGNSFTDLYGLRASCKRMKALAERSTVNHLYDVLSIPRRLNMPPELFKTCYAERNPSTLYMKGVQFFFTFNLQEEGFAFMKLAADERYERAVYTYAMTRKIFWGDEEYFVRFTRESVVRIGKLVRSLKWAWGLSHSDEFLAKRDEFISTIVPSFYSCQCVPVMERVWVLWHIENSKGDNMCNRCFWIKELGLFFREFEPMSVIMDTREW